MIRIALALVLAASAVSAQDWARERVEKSPRHREWVSLKHGNRSVETFVVYPESKAKTLKELVAMAKANPGKLNIGSISPGGT